MKGDFCKKVIASRVLAHMRSWYHFVLAGMAAVVYRFPSRSIDVIGVTGTKGKTTVVELLHAALEESGARVASVSSERFKIGNTEEKNTLKMTMPGRFFLQRFLRRAVREGCTHAVIEVTSQGIAQFRHRFIRFRTAVATNIAPEHIEAHGSFENYLRAKLDLFWRLPKEGVAVLNADDPYAARFAAATRGRIAWFGKEGIRTGEEEWRVRDFREGVSGISFELAPNRSHRKEMLCSSRLRGAFNAANVLAAAAVGISRHIAPEKIAKGIRCVEGVAGRMEWIQHEPFAVVVDYAHTPDSLEAVYRTLKGKSGTLVCVLGSAGGGRDTWKRPEFGRIAGEYCNTIILTNEDPYDENPACIIADISAGVASRKKCSVHEIIDRREAICFALGVAKKGDTVVLTGKGSEPWIMGPHGTRMPWGEVAVVREELVNIKIKL